MGTPRSSTSSKTSTKLRTIPILQEEALFLLAQFTDRDLLHRALEYAVSSKVRNQDSAILLAIALEIPENREQAWQFITTHWDQVHAQLTESSGSYVVGATGYFCSAEARDEREELFQRSSCRCRQCGSEARS